MRSSLLRIKAKLGLGVGIDIGEFWAAMGVAHHLFPYDGVLGSSSGTPDPKGCPRGGECGHLKLYLLPLALLKATAT